MPDARPAALAAGVHAYHDDLRSLTGKTRIIELEQGRARVAVAPELQGRVMTSAFRVNTASLGWIGRDAVKAGESADLPFNNYGGQDRFWLGPEGGPFALFFPQGTEQTADTWKVPDALDKGAFEVVSNDSSSVRMRKKLQLANAAGTAINLQVDRTIRLIERSAAAQLLGLSVPDDVEYVGFVSENRITNTGPAALTEAAGTASTWLIGMFPGRAQTVIIMPYRKGGDGEVVRQDYFKIPPANRLVIDEQGGVVLLRGDGQFQAKIGLPPLRAADRLGSIDFETKTLTIVHFDMMPGQKYVDSHWGSRRNDPFDGDVTNAYNHHGAFWGNFYELETSSPAALLEPGQSLAHYHRTLQFGGSIEALSKLSEKALGVGLERVRDQMK